MKVLIISKNEISYNPRLLKAADFFSDQNCSVTIFNPLTGLASKEIYNSTIIGKNWEVIENDIRKDKLTNSFNWLYVSVTHKILFLVYKVFKSGYVFERLYNKGLIGNKISLRTKYDYVYINLVDNLPFAAKIKKRTRCKIIYDSQEYFVGQYKKYDKDSFDWVVKSERLFIKDVDILLAPTDVMKERLVADYKLSIPCFRVRNLPSKRMLSATIPAKLDPQFTYLVWHGMSIYLDNARGVHLLIQALAKSTSNVKLVLQGVINNRQKAILNNYISKLQLEGKIILMPPADPYSIVPSLRHYDIGVIGEIPEEDNQKLTSSNKLFDYINAGLAVIVPDLVGLTETVIHYKSGLIYEPGNTHALALCIDKLANNRQMLSDLKTNAVEVSAKELSWEHDFSPVWDCMVQKK